MQRKNEEEPEVKEKPEVQEVEEEKEIRWQKIGGGTFRLRSNGKRAKIIKPLQKFNAKISEIPEAFRDSIVPLDADQLVPEEISVPPGVSFEIQSKGSGWFDVVNIASGKAVNTKALRGEDAKILLKELT